MTDNDKLMLLVIKEKGYISISDLCKELNKRGATGTSERNISEKLAYFEKEKLVIKDNGQNWRVANFTDKDVSFLDLVKLTEALELTE